MHQDLNQPCHSGTLTQPCHTGGSGGGFLENLLFKALNRPYFVDNNPRLYKRGSDIKTHLRRVDDYVSSLTLDESGKCACLINSLEESIQFELFSHLDYTEHSEDYKWIREKLEILLGERSSTASPLMQLLKVKQGSDQSLREFVTDIRVNATKIMGTNCDPQKREEYMIVTFINGLANNRAAVALRQLSPKTLEECYLLVKKETSKSCKLSENDNHLRILGNNDNKIIENLQNQLTRLQSQVNYLTSIIQQKESPLKPSYAQAARRQMGATKGRPQENQLQSPNEGRPGQQFQHRFQPRIQPRFQCYNCGQLGHMARDCRNTPVCSLCREIGHNSRVCRKNNFKRVRRLYEENMSENDVESGSLAQSHVPKEEEMIEASVCVLAEPQESLRQENVISVTKVQQKSRAPVKRNEEVEKWTAYIYGNGAKPRTKSSPTLISRSRPERAANKPLVRAEIEGTEAKVFLDSGAELNVIEESFVKSLLAHNKNIKIQQSDVYIRCANDSRMKGLGKVCLNMSLNGCHMRQTFTIVRGLFPKVIVGIRQMKRCNIMVDPGNDCVWVGTRRVPFVSKVQSIDEQENGWQLIRRA